MALQHSERELGQLGDHDLARIISGAHEAFKKRHPDLSDIPLPPAVTPVATRTVAQTPEAQVEIKRFSQDQLILPETQIPQEVSDILQRAERAGLTLEPYNLLNVVLDENSEVEGWNSKPESWYWENIKKGNISQDAPKLSDSWVLIDPITRPDYNRGRQLHENDHLGPLLAKLRKDKRIGNIRGVPEISRFGISHDELKQVVLPEIAELLGVEASAVRLPKAIEFNLIGNMKHPEWGKANTWEWFEDKFGDGHRLVGGYPGRGGLARVSYNWSDNRHDRITFRPLVVVSPKA